MTAPPTGIIRTLPPIYADPKHLARINYLASCEQLGSDPDYTIAFALSGKPKHDLLHVYVVIAGHLDARFLFVGYRDGKPCRLWDGKLRTPKVWAVCCGPIERPPQPIRMRGFQGFRYVHQPLW